MKLNLSRATDQSKTDVATFIALYISAFTTPSTTWSSASLVHTWSCCQFWGSIWGCLIAQNSLWFNLQISHGSWLSGIGSVPFKAVLVVLSTIQVSDISSIGGTLAKHGHAFSHLRRLAFFEPYLYGFSLYTRLYTSPYATGKTDEYSKDV